MIKNKLAGIKTNFSESLNIGMYADFRVFIFGVEVTEYVTGTLSWNYADRDGDNTATFDLTNANDIFILTEKNLGLEKTTSKTGETFFNNTGKYQFNLPKTDLMYSEAVKKEILEKKQSYNPAGKKPVYPLGLRNLVFHKNDTLRIFVCNPLNPNHWLNVFTGYLDNVSKTSNYINGQSNLSITAYDIRTLMRQMRVSMSPTYGQREMQEITMSPNEFFGDLINPTVNNHPYARMTFEETMKALITGKEGSDTSDPTKGVGRFTEGFKYYYDTSSKNQSPKVFSKGKEVSSFKNNSLLLEEWYDLLIGNYLTYDEVTEIGTKCAPGDEYAPDAQMFHMLLPKKENGSDKGTALGASSLTEFHFSQGVEQKDFSNRYDIIKDFCETIDYQFWVTGSGDIVFEFPMYEFQPKDFGPRIEKILSIDELILDDSIVDEEGDVITVLTVTGGINSDQLETRIEGLESDLIPRVIIANPGLAARFGVNASSHTLPTVTNKNSLRVLGAIEYQRRLSVANKVSFNFSYRPWIFPNKPVYHVTEERIGNVSSFSNRMTLFDTCSSDLTLRYIRKRNEQGRFTFLDGTRSILASYKQAWTDQSGNGSLDSGPIFVDINNSVIKSGI